MTSSLTADLKSPFIQTSYRIKNHANTRSKELPYSAQTENMTKDNEPKSRVTQLRDKLREIKKNIRISPELEEATREKKPTTGKDGKTDRSDYDNRKIASPKRDRDLDL